MKPRKINMLAGYNIDGILNNKYAVSFYFQYLCHDLKYYP